MLIKSLIFFKKIYFLTKFSSIYFIIIPTGNGIHNNPVFPLVFG